MGELKSYLAQVKREFGTVEATEHTYQLGRNCNSS
jgi:hypothetical protein